MTKLETQKMNQTILDLDSEKESTLPKQIKIAWAWSDEESVYLNEADSLEDIMNEVIYYYYYNGMNLSIKKSKNLYKIKFQECNGSKFTRYTIETDSGSVADFLTNLARQVDRPDSHDISEISSDS